MEYNVIAPFGVQIIVRLIKTMGNKEQQHGICCVFGKDEYLTLLDSLFNYKNFLDSKIAEALENEDQYSFDFYTDKDNKARALYNHLESFIAFLNKHDCI